MWLIASAFGKNETGELCGEEAWAGCSWPAACHCSGLGSARPPQSTAALCLSQSMGWHFRTGYYQKDSCWCLLQLPILKVALGSYWAEYVCTWLFIPLCILELKERSVWRLAAHSLVPLSLPLTHLHVKEYHRLSNPPLVLNNSSLQRNQAEKAHETLRKS